MPNFPQTYDRTTISLHWFTAACVALLWVIGQTADWISDGRVNTAYWSFHVVLGLVLTVVLLFRMAWRATAGRGLPAADAGALHVLAKTTHVLLYGLLLGVVALGIANALVRGYDLFGVVRLPQIGDRALRRPITQWHGLVANILLGVAAFHAAAALAHQYLWRDGLIGRMSLARRPADRR